MILRLTTMNCYHAAQGKPEQFTPQEEREFKAADNLFRGAVISALAEKYVDSYIRHKTAKELWMHWMLSSGCLMLGVSCTLWSNCMTTRWLRTVL